MTQPTDDPFIYAGDADDAMQQALKRAGQNLDHLKLRWVSVENRNKNPMYQPILGKDGLPITRLNSARGPMMELHGCSKHRHDQVHERREQAWQAFEAAAFPAVDESRFAKDSDGKTYCFLRRVQSENNWLVFDKIEHHQVADPSTFRTVDLLHEVRQSSWRILVGNEEVPKSKFNERFTRIVKANSHD